MEVEKKNEDTVVGANVRQGEIVLPDVAGGALAKREESSLDKMDLSESIPAKQFKLDKVAIEVIRELKCPGASRVELMWFLYQCAAMGLNPLMPGQITFLAYTNKRGERKHYVMVEIGGMRNLCLRTQRYRQGDPPLLEWDDKTGKPTKVTVSLYEKFEGQWVKRERVFAWNEFRAFHAKDMWMDMPGTMFAKCAEAALLRFYFPDSVSGTYTPDEMDAPDVAGLLNEAPKPRTITERAKELLDIAYGRLKAAGTSKPREAAVALARKAVPNHPGTDTWGEPELAAFRLAVERLDATPSDAPKPPDGVPPAGNAQGEIPGA